MGFLAYNLLHLFRRLYMRSEKARWSIEWMIMRLVKVGGRIVYHAPYWHVHIASALALRHHYRLIFGLTALSGHTFRDRLQNLGGIGMAEIRKRWGSDRLRGPICGVVNGFLPVSSLQTKAEALKKGNRRCGKAFWTLLPHYSE
jgi:hypothetical protein